MRINYSEVFYMNKTRKNIFNIVFTGLMTALLCVMGPLSIPLPGLVPISLTLFAIYFIVYIIGGVRGTICVVLYLLLGMVGLPVFSGFSGGLGKLSGPTGGYLIGFIFTAVLCGVALKLGKGKIWVYLIGCVLGCLAAYVFGSLWFMISLGKSVGATLSACVIPFLPFDAAKIVVVGLAGPGVKALLRKIPGSQDFLA